MSRYGLLYAQNEVDSIDSTSRPPVGNDSAVDSMAATETDSEENAYFPHSYHDETQSETAPGRSFAAFQRKLHSDSSRKRGMPKNCRRRRRSQKNLRTLENDLEKDSLGYSSLPP
ncbi:uncharacterized protein LOC125178712 [Hyalella azteca]|uniref:Uncharacterized protein LOC125178712 n=1 Tax=Hyalella azteca TaxID=294128 RepID=A0A979FPQ0_HYAAZ|nr:uncharacterized protein LOC125178712 [Hyalella azteca]